MIHIVDHLFMLLLFVVQPIHGARETKRYLARVEAGEPAAPAKLYRDVIKVEWAALAVLAVTWYLLGRPAADLGFVAPGGREFWIGAVILAAVSAFLLYMWRLSKMMTAEKKAEQRLSFGKLVHLLPRSWREYQAFFGASMTAGVVEETIYRGFALWYLVQFMPIWAAVIASSIVFGLGHSYQGAGGMVRVTVIGLVFGIYYLFTGSIWLPILGHFLFDALQGASIVEVLREDTDASEPQVA